MAQWLWPLQGGASYTMTSGVGPRWGTTHKGIDLAAASGTPVLATREGKVISAATTCVHNYGKSDVTGPNRDRCGGGAGNFVKINHQDGYESYYYHLTDVNVKIGDIVSAGQVIGTVGSTGNSTGPHLHFEIRYNGKVQDPENFVSSDNSIISPYTASSGNISNTRSTSTNSEVTLTNLHPDDVTGKRVAELTNQPLYAYYEIKVGGTTLTSRPNVYQNFEINRLEGAGEEITFTLFDDTWDEIEKLLTEYWDKVTISYGYEGGLRSKEYNVLLSAYKIAFNSTGVLLTVSAMSQGAYDNMKPINLALNTKNPTVAIRKIGQYMGWDVSELEETVDITDMADDFNMIQEYPVQYIKQHITEYARTPDGESVVFQLEDNGGAGKVYFERESYNISSITSEENLRTYIYMKGYDSPIISIEFDIKGVFGGTSQFNIASGERISIFDVDDKTEISHKEDMSTVVLEASGEYSHTKIDQSVPLIDSAGRSPTQAKYKLWHDVSIASREQYEAYMTIIGDPTISLHETIWIINVTDDGFPHHTSGAYMVNGITDTISNGQMITSLKLVRNGDIQNGVEIISPKVLVTRSR